MVLHVYLDPCTVNSRKVLAGLDLIGTKYEYHFINYFAGEHKDEEYKKINPMATVPSAVDGDLMLNESNAILQYAADLDGGSPAYPKDLKQRASVNRWLLWEASVWFQSCYVYLVENVVKPLLKAEPDAKVIEAEAPKWHRLAAILDDQLQRSQWLCGDQPTIADIAVAVGMHLHPTQRLPLDEHPALKRWMVDGVEKLPCWVKTQAAVEKALLPPSKGSSSSVQGTVKANFNYTKDVDGLTELYFYESDAAKNIHEPGDDPHEMDVRDGWGLADRFSADEHGFSVHDFTSAYGDWEDEGAVRQTFYPEIVDFVKKTTGARRVLVFDHTIRTKGNAAKKLTQESDTSQRAPVTLVHCDYTAESGPVRVKQLLPDEADELLSRCVAFLNVWKPIRRTVEEHPLAMCDVTSAPAQDFFKLHLRYRDRDGENYVMRHSPAHR